MTSKTQPIGNVRGALAAAVAAAVTAMAPHVGPLDDTDEAALRGSVYVALAEWLVSTTARRAHNITDV